jgi:phosphoribosylanthranilate isomerase
MKLKVCGMREQQNINDLVNLKPDYIGFIFYDKSSRNVNEPVNIDSKLDIEKVGVFVNEGFNEIEEKIREYGLDIVQLHGSESSEFCLKVKQIGVKVIKAFSIDPAFEFSLTHIYKNHCNYFLEMLNDSESNGKKLGFISQEIGREINTIGSKANDSDIQKFVVLMKDELEKIKEQMLNIL